MRRFGSKNDQGRNRERQRAAEQQLRGLAMLPLAELWQELDSRPEGLSHMEAAQRLDDAGLNTITTGKRNTVARRLMEALLNPFNLILAVIAVITYITDVVVAVRPDYLTLLIIVTLVLISAAVGFIQSRRSDKAAESLQELVSNRCHVLRDGAYIELPMIEVVPGDVVRLSSGDMLPADLRFLSSKDTFIAQAALTGESAPVEKFSDRLADSDAALTDIPNIGFMGSNVVSGSSEALILATGDDTYIGSMSRSLSGDKARTSFERGVSQVSRLLVRMMLIMVPAVLLVNGLLKQDWPSALLFAISVAVGLTPEMPPVIMTSTLARGAVTMSRHKVIVRTLGAIQTFGEMDILCTDKTGTLTEDRIVLERYMNVHGEDDRRILRHAFLNSSFQTGLKNLIDLAIIRRAEQYGLHELLGGYSRVDEIPFDFARRRMSVVLSDRNGKRQLITKGAVEEMLAISDFVELGGEVVPLDDETRRSAMATYEKHNSEGLRMIAVAQKNEVPDSEVFSVKDESGMVLIGFVGFLDPPKESAAAALTALKDHGVRTVVLTGDSEGVAVKVCGKVGVDTSVVLMGSDVEKMSDTALQAAIGTCDLFAKLSPSQKERVVAAFQRAGHTVGYMGDGINDAQAIRQADVGISVDSAVDIARETADIILLEKDLMVLEEGVVEGRRTFGNIVKYIKLAASGNFGNIIAVLAASILLPFLPMLPVQLLTQNLLADFAQMGIAFDRMDEGYLKKPRRWETASIRRFMVVMGILSSVFDLLCFAILWWIIGANRMEMSPLFQAGWFVFGTVSQVLVIHTIRTARLPFVHSMPSGVLMVSTAAVAIIALAVGFTGLAVGLDMMPLPLRFAPWLVLLLIAYFITAHLIKKHYIKRYGEWL